jgi:tetratricopeptide (TPR) repeat protein
VAEERKEFSLDAVRTDGWFERIGEGIGSFQALCEIVGERFFAFSIVVGARITALTVDRRSPDQTLVDFVVGAGDADADLEPQRLTLADFRRRLVGALLVEDDASPPPPTRETDIEAIQLYIGVRYLLIAPLFGYSLRQLRIDKREGGAPRGGPPPKAEVTLSRDGEDETYELSAFRMRIRAHVREELERAAAGARSAIDLSKVADAEAAGLRGEWAKVVQLLGAWPAPLAIFLRTPEGQMLTPDARGLIAKGLGLLGSACVHLGEVEQAEEVFRIGIQYAQEGLAAADLFRRLGEALLLSGRPGEAVGSLRRAVAFGGPVAQVMPPLARAFLQRKRFVAAYACIREALEAGVAERELAGELREIEGSLGHLLTSWKAKVINAGPGSKSSSTSG